MWKFKSWKGKDKWLFLMTVGVILCILAFPAERIFGTGGQTEGKSSSPWTDAVGSDGSSKNRKASTENLTGNLTGDWEGGEDNRAYGVFPETREVSAKAADSYEAELEQRIRELLKHVDGVGEVDVMVVLQSSAEKVWQSDGSTSTSLTEEKDSEGGSRRIESRDMDHSTVLLSGDGKSEPMLTKELRPQISGIIISATGGGSPQIQAEISAAMEALFGLPAHKIKVLKRVE